MTMFLDFTPECSLITGQRKKIARVATPVTATSNSPGEPVITRHTFVVTCPSRCLRSRSQHTRSTYALSAPQSHCRSYPRAGPTNCMWHASVPVQLHTLTEHACFNSRLLPPFPADRTAALPIHLLTASYFTNVISCCVTSMRGFSAAPCC